MAFGRFFEGIREAIVGPERGLPPRVDSDLPTLVKGSLNTIRTDSNRFLTQLEQDNLNAENQQAAALARGILQNANPADAFRSIFVPGAPGSPQEALYNQHLALRNTLARLPGLQTRIFEQIVLNFIEHNEDPTQLPNVDKLGQLFDPRHAAFASVPAGIRRLVGDPGDPGDPTAVPPRPARPATPGTHPELSRSLRNAFEINQSLGTVNPDADIRRKAGRGAINLPPAELAELTNSIQQTETFLQNELGWDFRMLGGRGAGAPGPGGRPVRRPGGLNQPSTPEEAARLRVAGSVAYKHRFDYHNHVRQWRQARRDRDRGVITRDEAERIMNEQRLFANDAWIAFESSLEEVKSHFLIDSLHRKMRSMGLTEEQILAANDPRQFGMLIASDINRLYANIENMRRLEHLPTPGEEFEIRERSVWKALMEHWQRVPAPLRFAAGVAAGTGAFFGISAALAALFPTITVFGAGAAMVNTYGVAGATTVRAARGILGAGFAGLAQMVVGHFHNPRRIEQKYDNELQTLLQNNQEALLRDPAARRDLMRQLDENRLKMRRELSDKLKSRGRWGLLATLLVAPIATLGTCSLIEAAGNGWNFTHTPNTPPSTTAPATPGSGTGIHHPPPGTYGPPAPGTHGPGVGIRPEDLAKDPSKFLGAADKTYTIRSGDNFWNVLKDHNVFGLSAGDSDYAWKHTMVQSGLDGKLHPLGDMSLTHPGDRVHLIKLPDGYHYVITPDSHQPLGHTAGYHAEVLENKNQPPAWMENKMHGHTINHFPDSHDTTPQPPHHGGRGGSTSGTYGGDPYGGNPYNSGNVYDTGSAMGADNWSTNQTVDTPQQPQAGGGTGAPDVPSNATTGGTASPDNAPASAATPGLGQPERLPSKSGLEPFKGLTVDQYINATKNGVSAGIGADAAAQAQATEFTQHSAHHKSLAGVLTEHLNKDVAKTDTVEQALKKLNITPRN